MKGLYILLFGLTSMQVAISQNIHDPQAKKLLDELYEKYTSYSTLSVDFDLDITIADGDKYLQKGNLIQKNNQFKLKSDDQEIICDGKSVWVYYPENKEIQINDYDENDESINSFSPKALLNSYRNNKYEYALVDSPKGKTGILSYIEFKPKDKESEYSKIRLEADRKAKKINKVEVFLKDGSKYILKITALSTNKNYDSSVFTLNAKDYPNIHIEDLRID